MSGAEFKNKINELNVKFADLAIKLEMSQQSLSAAFLVKDIKTGFVEKIAAALDIDPLYFYSGGKCVNKVVGDCNQMGNFNTITGNDKLVEKLLDELSKLREQNARLMEILINKIQ